MGLIDDPIVAEIRAAREQIAAECDYDFGKLLARAEEVLRNWPGRVVTREEVLRDRARGRPPKGAKA